MGWFRKRDNEIYIGDWYIGWHSWRPCFKYCSCGYTDSRSCIEISLFGWYSVFRLPWESKNYSDGDIDRPEWGFDYVDRALVWVWNKGYWSWDLPFVSYGSCYSWKVYTGPKTLHPKFWTYADWCDYKTDNGYTGEKHATRWDYVWVDYDGTEVPCTFYVEEQEWRPKWLEWTSLFAKVRREIDVSYSTGIGHRKDTWKGGIYGWGHKMLNNETPMACIERMHKEKQFEA